jgi:hypothetical protein
MQRLQLRWRCGADAQITDTGSGYCETHHVGPLCQVCAVENQYRDDVTGLCEMCRVQGSLGWIGLGLFFGAVATLGLGWLLYFVSSFENVYGLKLPERVLQVKRAFDWTQVQWLGVVLPAKCLGDFENRLLMNALAPIILVVLVFAGVLVYCIYTQRKDLSFKQVVHLALLAATPVLLYVSFIFVPSVSATIFSTWLCKQISIDGTTSIRFMRDELSLQCDTPRHDQIKPVAWLLVTMWPIGVVALYFALLLKCRKPIVTRRPNKLVAATLFVHRDYEVWSARTRTRARTHAHIHARPYIHCPFPSCVQPNTSIGRQ